MLTKPKKVENLPYDKIFVFFYFVLYMFKDIYTKVSSKNNNKIDYDLSSNDMYTNDSKSHDKKKLATIKTELFSSLQTTANMVYESNETNDFLTPCEKTRKKSHGNIQYICDTCNYKTFIRCNYNKHVLSSLHKKINKIKTDNAFFCKICDYSTNRKNDYDKHMDTKRHMLKYDEYKNSKNKIDINQFLTNNNDNDNDNDKIVNINLLKDDITSIIIKEIKNMNEQNKLLLDIANKQNNTTIHNNQTNNQFNLNLFLNETCKDAMNMSEFIENLQVSMEDMEKTGELGFAKGMSRIIMNNLNAIDVCKRPIHCSDVKRETLYVKNNGVWEKETEERKRTKEVIYKISSLNVKQLLKWRDLPRNKGYEKSDHKKNDEFTKLVMEVNKLREEEIDKVITNISKHVAIDKDKEKVKMSGYLN